VKTHTKRAQLLLILVAAGCGRPPLSPTPPPWLDAAVTEQAAKMGGSPQLLGDIQRGVTHDEDESVVAQVNLEMGKCYVFAAAGDHSTVEEIKIYLFNPNGDRVLDKSEGSRTSASFCVTGQMVVNIKVMGWGSSVAMAVPGSYKLEVKTTEGNGHVAFAAFVQGGAPPAAPPPAPAEAPPPEPAPAEEH
jgi:hypothetical protein